MLGTIYTIKCHRLDTTLVLDSWARSVFSYVADSFSDGDSTVVKDNISMSLDDGYTVKILWTEGNEPDDTETRFDILTLAWFAINTALTDEVNVLTKVA